MERQQLLELKGENDRLLQLLALVRSAPEHKYLGARVVGVQLDPKGLQVVTIDKGSVDGLSKMMPVVVAQGVVGRIQSVLRWSSDVMLVVDRNSSIAVRVERSRARANVRGLNRPHVCALDYALRSEDMIEGDLLVTSGTDGVFPRGLSVGRVTGLTRTGNGLYQTADVIPAVDVTKIEEVLVITSIYRISGETSPSTQAP
jgi:rod shape-determining protein MreC